MKTTRKKMLLSSIAMLLVALVALGSATYAWFTINKTVEANTMQIKAKVAAGLEITNTNGKAWDRKVSFSGETELNPISVAGINSALPTNAFYPNDVSTTGVASATSGKAWQTYALSSKPAPSETDQSQAQGNVDPVMASDSYFAAYRIGIKSSDGNALGKKVLATITCATDATKHGEQFAKAVLLDSNGAVKAYYNDAAYTPISAVNGDSYTEGSSVAASSANAEVLNNISTANYYTLLTWFEGNDGQCIDDPGQGAQANFTVTFTLGGNSTP